MQADSIFSGISTFGRLKYHPCLSSDVKYDIAFIGMAVRLHSQQAYLYGLTNQQALHLTLELHTVRELVSAQVASGKVLAALISSGFTHSITCLLFDAVGIKAHARSDLVADTTSH